MPPIGTRHVRPPVVGIAQVDRACGLAEDHRRGFEQFRLRAGVVRRVRGPLGERDVPGRLDEAAKVGVGHGVPIHPETVDRHPVRGRLLRVMAVRPHEEGPARNPDHAFRRRLARRRRTLDELVVLRRRVDFHERSPSLTLVSVNLYTARINTAPNANRPMKINAIATAYNGVIRTTSPTPAMGSNSLLHR
jgi:hypothetical protein